MAAETFPVALTAALILPAVASSQETLKCEAVTKDQITALFDRWNGSLKTKNPDEVVKN